MALARYTSPTYTDPPHAYAPFGAEGPDDVLAPDHPGRAAFLAHSDGLGRELVDHCL